MQLPAFSPWFSTYGSTPVRSGPYQVMYGDAMMAMSYWDSDRKLWLLHRDGPVMVNVGRPGNRWRGVSFWVYFTAIVATLT
jgi:hypothetical protein